MATKRVASAPAPTTDPAAYFPTEAKPFACLREMKEKMDNVMYNFLSFVYISIWILQRFRASSSRRRSRLWITKNEYLLACFAGGFFPPLARCRNYKSMIKTDCRESPWLHHVGTSVENKWKNAASKELATNIARFSSYSTANFSERFFMFPNRPGFQKYFKSKKAFWIFFWVRL